MSAPGELPEHVRRNRVQWDAWAAWYAQLDTARAMQTRFGLDFPLMQGNAEQVPPPDGRIDGPPVGIR